MDTRVLHLSFKVQQKVSSNQFCSEIAVCYILQISPDAFAAAHYFQQTHDEYDSHSVVPPVSINPAEPDKITLMHLSQNFHQIPETLHHSFPEGQSRKNLALPVEFN